jgi:hypothetical protein
MIRKVTNPQDYLNLLEALDTLWAAENISAGHVLKIKKESLAQVASAQLLTWNYHVWASSNNDAAIMFSADNSLLFGEVIFQEIFWLSKNPRLGIKLLNTAKTFAKSKGWKYIMMGSSVRMNDGRLEKFYEKIGCVKDSECYIGCL